MHHARDRYQSAYLLFPTLLALQLDAETHLSTRLYQAPRILGGSNANLLGFVPSCFWLNAVGMEKMPSRDRQIFLKTVVGAKNAGGFDVLAVKTLPLRSGDPHQGFEASDYDLLFLGVFWPMPAQAFGMLHHSH